VCAGRPDQVENYRILTKRDIRCIAVWDANNDGFPDIVFTSCGHTNGVRAWLNRGNDRWEKGVRATKSGRFEGVTLYDVNKDGNLDVAANCTSDIEGGIESG